MRQMLNPFCLLVAAAVVVVGCGKDESAAAKPAVASAKKAVEVKPPPYTYPAPVKGHYKEVNIGEFDVVDGIAYTATGNAGTVVYATSKAIASPLLADSACPMTMARALTELRDANYMEVTLDSRGISKYFAAGTAFNGSSKDTSPGGRYWQSRLKQDAGHAAGNVVHRNYGHFEFDMPLYTPQVNEFSEGDSSDGLRYDKTLPKPTEAAVTVAYKALHDAAMKKDLKALLAAQGFDKQQVAAIRGLDGIDSDFAVYADRFLSPGNADDFTARPGTAYVHTLGVNSKGKKFANYYHFVPCGTQLVMVRIAENPQ
ncbi:MAG: hypothetical protein ABI537_02725 [Casimicrobiaceae bacterium]